MGRKFPTKHTASSRVTSPSKKDVANELELERLLTRAMIWHKHYPLVIGDPNSNRHVHGPNEARRLLDELRIAESSTTHIADQLESTEQDRTKAHKQRARSLLHLAMATLGGMAASIAAISAPEFFLPIATLCGIVGARTVVDVYNAVNESLGLSEKVRSLRNELRVAHQNEQTATVVADKALLSLSALEARVVSLPNTEVLKSGTLEHFVRHDTSEYREIEQLIGNAFTESPTLISNVEHAEILGQRPTDPALAQQWNHTITLYALADKEAEFTGDLDSDDEIFAAEHWLPLHRSRHSQEFARHAAENFAIALDAAKKPMSKELRQMIPSRTGLTVDNQQLVEEKSIRFRPVDGPELQRGLELA